MRNATFRFLALVVAVFLIGGAAPLFAGVRCVGSGIVTFAGYMGGAK